MKYRLRGEVPFLLEQEEEGAVLPNRPADLAASAVVAPFGIFDAPPIPKPIVGVHFVVLVIPIAAAVPTVGASDRHHLHLGAHRTGELHAGVVRLHAEFFQALHWRGNYRARRGHKSSVIPAAALHIAGGIAAV